MLCNIPGCGENCYVRKGLLREYAGIPKGMMTRHADRIVRADADMMITDGIRLLAHTTPDLGKQGLIEKMYLKQGFMHYIPDDFRHEQSLVFEAEDGVVFEVR